MGRLPLLLMVQYVLMMTFEIPGNANQRNKHPDNKIILCFIHTSPETRNFPSGENASEEIVFLKVVKMLGHFL